MDFFVIGADRSGTTLLRLILNAHSRICIPPETWWLIDLERRFGSRRDARHNVGAMLETISRHRRWPDLELSPAEVAEAVATLPPEASIAALTDALFDLIAVREGKTVKGDKSPEYVLHVRWLDQLFEGAKFIHIVRDPRDVVASLLRAGFRGHDLFRAAAYWRWHVQAGLRAEAIVGPERYRLVRYEELVLDGERIVRDLFAFIGVDFEADALAFHRDAERNVPAASRGHHGKLSRPSEATDVERWRHELSPAKVRRIEAIVGPLATRLGYQLAGPPPLLDWAYPPAISAHRALLATADLRKRLGLRRSVAARQARMKASLAD